MEISEEERQKIREKIEALKASKFKQQMLPAWRPVPSFGSTMITFGIFGLVFMTLGIALYVMSDKIQEVSFNYTDCALPATSEFGDSLTCTKTVEISNDIEGPIYVYYQLENFYQNHRRYVRSRSYEQLMGETLSVDDLSDCDPVTTNQDLEPYITKAQDGTPLDPAGPANPCGLIAKSVFTDKFSLFLPAALGGANITMDDSNIAWASDVEYKFKNGPEIDGASWESYQWLDVTNCKSLS